MLPSVQLFYLNQECCTFLKRDVSYLYKLRPTVRNRASDIVSGTMKFYHAIFKTRFHLVNRVLILKTRRLRQKC